MPDLSTFGKGMANGFSVSALAGRRETMQLGGYDHDRERVFLLSTTHGAQTHELAAALATMQLYESEPVVETSYARGRQLRQGLDQAAAQFGLSAHVGAVSRDCDLLFFTRDAEGRPSQPFRTLFMQELVTRGIVAPSFVASYSHSPADVDRTIDVVATVLKVYRQALDSGIERFQYSGPVKPVFQRFA